MGLFTKLNQLAKEEQEKRTFEFPMQRIIDVANSHKEEIMRNLSNTSYVNDTSYCLAMLDEIRKYIADDMKPLRDRVCSILDKLHLSVSLDIVMQSLPNNAADASDADLETYIKALCNYIL